MHDDPILFFDKPLPLLVLCILLSKKKKILNVRHFNFIAISTQIRLNFSTNAGLYMTYNYPSLRPILPEETILPAKMY